MNEIATPEDNQTVTSETTQAATPLPGAALRAERERQGMSVADVAQHTRLASRQIEALEADDYDLLPELPFVRGFIRSYARLLQIAPEPLLAGLPHDDHSSVPRMPPSVEAPFPSPFMVHRRNLVLVGAAVLLLVLLGLWLAWSPTSTVPAPVATETTAVSPQTLPLPVQNQAPADASGVPAVPEIAAAPVDVPAAKVHLQMAEKTWVEIRDRAGNVLLSQNNPAGSDMQIEGMTPLSLVLGQTRGVQLTFNGRPVALPPTVDPNSGVARLTLE